MKAMPKKPMPALWCSINAVYLHLSDCCMFVGRIRSAYAMITLIGTAKGMRIVGGLVSSFRGVGMPGAGVMGERLGGRGRRRGRLLLCRCCRRRRMSNRGKGRIGNSVFAVIRTCSSISRTDRSGIQACWRRIAIQMRRRRGGMKSRRIGW